MNASRDSIAFFLRCLRSEPFNEADVLNQWKSLAGNLLQKGGITDIECARLA